MIKSINEGMGLIVVDHGTESIGTVTDRFSDGVHTLEKRVRMNYTGDRTNCLFFT